jgi:hypothetical protein
MQHEGQPQTLRHQAHLPRRSMSVLGACTLSQRRLDRWAGRILRRGEDLRAWAYQPLSQTRQRAALAGTSPMLPGVAVADGTEPGGAARRCTPGQQNKEHRVVCGSGNGADGGHGPQPCSTRPKPPLPHAAADRRPDRDQASRCRPAASPCRQPRSREPCSAGPLHNAQKTPTCRASRCSVWG